MSRAVWKKSFILSAVAICAIGLVLLAGCGRPDATPEADDTWARVQAAGKIIAGTAADYPPFEFWNEDKEIDGFDVALMDEIGERLGVEVQYRDLAFDGLGAALELGEIDVAIAAISVTSEREERFAFSNVYLVSEDGILAREGAGIDIEDLDDLSPYRVGVQRDTVHEGWLRAELVATGLLPSGNLFVYGNATDLYRDLTMNRLDLALVDIQPALVAVNEGGVELAGRGLNQMRLAIALPKGAETLKGEIDAALVDLFNAGMIASLSDLYLGQSELLPTPTPAPESTKAPPAAPPSCVDGLQFVEHPQGDVQNSRLSPGQAFTKVWRVKNSGSCTWDTSYRVVHVDGAVLGGGPTGLMGSVSPGQTYDVAVNMVAPMNPGTYEARWQMVDGSGQAFGERLPVTIHVSPPPTVPPAPTQTPVPGIAFWVDRDQIAAGECVWFSWRVSNVREVYFYAEGQRWQDGGVAGEGTAQECPAATTNYYLRVVLTDGSIVTRQITIYVTPAPGKPVIEYFGVEPAGPIAVGQCVTVRWKASGDIDVVRIFINDKPVWDPAPIEGQYVDCPPAAGTFGYAMSANGPGGRSERNQRVQVQ